MFYTSSWAFFSISVFLFHIHNFNFDINFNLADEIIKKERIKAFQWLKESLEQKPDEIDKCDLLYDLFLQHNNKKTPSTENNFSKKINFYKNKKEKLFSIKSIVADKENRIIVTILGIKMKFKKRTRLW